MPAHQELSTMSPRSPRPTGPRDPCPVVPTLTAAADVMGRLDTVLAQVTALLADRPTVTAHVQQALTGLAEARRCVDHAVGTLDFNAGCTRRP